MNFSNFLSLSRSFVRAPLTPARSASAQHMRACVLRPLASAGSDAGRADAMRASSVRVLEVAGDVPVPQVCAADVLIRIHASTINPLDNQMRFGYAKSIADLKIESPLILGRECSGVIEKIGPNVWNFKRGDEVVAATAPFRQGAHAEYMAVDESEIALKPKNLSHIESASLPFNALTAWNAISIAQIESGTKVLVLGGSGRVGFSLVSLLVRHFKCQVTTTSSPHNMQKIVDLGLSQENIIDHTQLSTLQGGYDVVFDVVGTAQSEAACVAQLRDNGAYITFNGNLVRHADKSGVAGLAQGALESACKRAKMMRDSRGVRYGYALFSPSGSNLNSLMRMAEQGVLVPDVGQVFPLEQIEQAYSWSGSGKVVLTTTQSNQTNAATPAT